QYPEHRLVLWAARKLGRPVRWQCERREAILADEHARDNVSEAELALDADGRFLAMRVRTLANVGAYVSSDRNLLATFGNVITLVGVYKFEAAYVHVTSVMTNTNSTSPASRFAATSLTGVASCGAWPSSTRSSRRPDHSPSSPRSGSPPAAARPS